MKYPVILSAFLLFAASSAEACLKLPSIIGDNAVIQQNSNIRLWGLDTPGATVSVQPSWSDISVSAIADDNGRWELTLATPPASMNPLDIRFTDSEGDDVAISNLLSGDISCAYGGSKVEGWLPRDILASYPGWNVDKEMADTTLQEYERINVMYNAMLNPVKGYTIKGFLWNQGMTIDGNRAVLDFTGAESGFTPNDTLEGFEAACDDGIFYPASATEDWNTRQIIVTSDKVDHIKNVRYCFHNFAIGTVRNLMGLPLFPFRTDTGQE